MFSFHGGIFVNHVTDEIITLKHELINNCKLYKMSTIVIIGILDSTIITLLSSDIVSAIHVVDVLFWSPLEPSSFHQYDNAESKCQQEQNEENT